jgi:hypothetical protein
MLDGAVGVMRRYPRPTLGMSAAVAVVMALLNLVLLLTLLRPLADLDPTPRSTGDSEQLQTLLGGARGRLPDHGAAGLLTTAVLTGILTAVVGKAVLGQPLDVREAWQTVRPHSASWSACRCSSQCWSPPCSSRRSPSRWPS